MAEKSKRDIVREKLARKDTKETLNRPDDMSSKQATYWNYWVRGKLAEIGRQYPDLVIAGKLSDKVLGFGLGHKDDWIVVEGEAPRRAILSNL